jgi:hypothetical protein
MKIMFVQILLGQIIQPGVLRETTLIRAEISDQAKPSATAFCNLSMKHIDLSCSPKERKKEK